MPAISITDLNNAQLDVNTIASVATSTAATVTDRLGNTKNTLSGFNAALLASSASLQASVTASNASILASAAAVQGSIGYLPPVTYVAGINLTVAVQTVSYTGQTYAPLLSALPFTTTGTFETAKFRLIQGVAGADLAASGGAVLVGFQQIGVSAPIRNISDKLREIYSVLDGGADSTGAVDATSAFSYAAINAPANSYMLGTSIARAQSVDIAVPAGTYLLGSLVDTGGRDVTWHLDSNAVIANQSNLNGRVVRGGVHLAAMHYGTADYATGIFINSNGASADSAPVLGLASPSELALYSDRDSVGVMAYSVAPPILMTLTSTTYTATTVVPLSPLVASQRLKLRVGMIIDTAHVPTKYSGFITGWAADGTSINVSAWYKVDGTGTASTPSNGPSALVNPFTKVWAHNSNATLLANSFANEASGFELNLVNNKGASTTEGAMPKVVGFDTTNQGINRCETAYLVRGDFWKGFEVIAGGFAQAAQVGFQYTGTNTGFSCTGLGGGPVGYKYKGVGTAFAAYQPDGAQFFNLDASGSIEQGSTNTAGPVFTDMHTSGNNIDYDVRLLATGGTAVSGNGTLTVLAANLVAPNTQPSADTGASLGTVAKRFLFAYARYFLPGAGTAVWTSGAGTPEGVLSAVPGSLYTRTDGGANTTLYIKETGTAATGWIAK